MQRYENAVGDTGVTRFELGDDFIIVEFRGGKTYRYSHDRAGEIHVTRMKQLAAGGLGLSTYISRYVRDLYDR